MPTPVYRGAVILKLGDVKKKSQEPGVGRQAHRWGIIPSMTTATRFQVLKKNMACFFSQVRWYSNCTESLWIQVAHSKILGVTYKPFTTLLICERAIQDLSEPAEGMGIRREVGKGISIRSCTHISKEALQTLRRMVTSLKLRVASEVCQTHQQHYLARVGLWDQQYSLWHDDREHIQSR